MSSIGEAVREKTVSFFTNFVAPLIRWSETRRLFIEAVSRAAIEDSAAYVNERMHDAFLFDSRTAHLRFAVGQIAPALREGIVAEFGVWRGESLNFIASLLPGKTVYGFDSFLGLQDDWTGGKGPKKLFDRRGRPPRVRENVQLVKGWFPETLPGFCQEHPEKAAFLHVDCDTYDSTKAVLTHLADRIVPGTVILFDEYFGYRGWREHEHKAFQEFVSSRNLTYRYLSFKFESVTVRIL